MMTAPAGTDVIALEALRVGMYVHLDLGWMEHPFALSHFKITSADQIDTLRGLGLERLRWSPALSDLPEPAHAAVVPAAASDRGQAGQPGQLPAAAQAQALAQGEQQFSEAAQALAGLQARVAQAPADARAEAEALASALLDKMAGEQALCIRLLGEATGERGITHALNVTVLSLLLGRACGWGRRELGDLGVGALLHDIGKLELPERVRQRDEAFTPAEQRAYEDHVAQGVAQARRLGLSAGALLVIAQHHELADRSGFPMRIGNDRMTAAARVVALVNRYDRLCHPARPHLALTPHEAVSLMYAQFKTRFDAELLDAFVRMMGIYPPGSLVQLSDERLGIVVSVNASRPLKPCVQVYEPGSTSANAPVLDLEAAVGLGIRRSLKPQALPKDALRVLAPRQRLAFFFEPALAAPPGSLRRGEAERCAA